MAAVTDLELPRFEYLDPELRGDRFHDTMRELRESSWIASSEFGYFVLDREAAGFFLRSRSATFPGVQMFELLGITEGPLRDLRWLLHTRDAHALYAKFGFGPPGERVMERPPPD